MYRDYQFVPKPTFTGLATNAIEFHLYDFLESIPYVWAQVDTFLTIYRQTETAKRTAREF